jgi:hypothetical protein
VTTSTTIGKAFVALAALAVAGVTLVVGAVPAAPASTAKCVAVLVDFRQLGGTVQTGCAQGDPATGLQALSDAGFSYAPRPRDQLICQIDARPACSASTSSTYWSYWYRAAGSSRWVYASEGAGTHNPKPGSTEGWVWQAGGKTPPPSIRADVICPQLAATPSPKPTTPKATPQPTGSTSAKSPKAHASTGPPAAATTARTRSASAMAGSSTGSPTASQQATSATASATASAAAVTNGSSGGGSAASGPADQGNGGGALNGVAGLTLGGTVVLGIGAAAAVRARRGRSP